MPNNILSIEQVLALLGAGPARINELTTDFGPTPLRATPANGEWSPNDVLAHLRACADVWGACMASILEGERTLRAVNPRTWIKETDYLDQDFETSLRAFARQRTELLALLRPLPRGSWSRSVLVTGAGRPLRRDVRFYGEKMARHERAHVKQIARLLGLTVTR